MSSVKRFMIVTISWLHQARNDPSLSWTQVDAWSTSLETQLHQATTRYDFAKLFGDLLDEWLKSGDSLNTVSLPEDNVTTDVGADVKAVREGMFLSFNPHIDQLTSEPKIERFVQQQRISDLIFEAKPTDTSAITAYLEDLFSEPEAAAALTGLRSTVSFFGDKLRKDTVYYGDMVALINSLLARDLLSPEKTSTIKGFLDSEVIIQEVTSVLNMQLASLDTWDWPMEGVHVDMRRHLSGKYRYVFYHCCTLSFVFRFTVDFQSIHGQRNHASSPIPVHWHEMERSPQKGLPLCRRIWGLET
jgi:hypothetical protein